MHERSKADSFPWSADILSAVRGHPARSSSVLFRKPLALGVIIAHLERAIQQAFHVDTFTNRLTGRSRLSLLNKVAPTKFFGSQTNRLRNFIHLTFQPKDTLRRAESAERTVRRHVRRYCSAVNANMRAEVRPGGVNRAARKHDRRERAIRAAIDHKVDLHR